jgi:hypothetical protein
MYMSVSSKCYPKTKHQLFTSRTENCTREAVKSSTSEMLASFIHGKEFPYLGNRSLKSFSQDPDLGAFPRLYARAGIDRTSSLSDIATSSRSPLMSRIHTFLSANLRALTRPNENPLAASSSGSATSTGRYRASSPHSLASAFIPFIAGLHEPPSSEAPGGHIEVAKTKVDILLFESNTLDFIRSVGFQGGIGVLIRGFKGSIVAHIEPDILATISQMEWLMNRYQRIWQDAIVYIPKDTLELVKNIDWAASESVSGAQPRWLMSLRSALKPLRRKMEIVTYPVSEDFPEGYTLTVYKDGSGTWVSRAKTTKIHKLWWYD